MPFVPTCGPTRHSTTKEPFQRTLYRQSAQVCVPLDLNHFNTEEYQARKCVWTAAASCEAELDRGNGICVVTIGPPQTYPPGPIISGLPYPHPVGPCWVLSLVPCRTLSYPSSPGGACCQADGTQTPAPSKVSAYQLLDLIISQVAIKPSGIMSITRSAGDAAAAAPASPCSPGAGSLNPPAASALSTPVTPSLSSSALAAGHNWTLCSGCGTWSCTPQATSRLAGHGREGLHESPH